MVDIGMVLFCGVVVIGFSAMMFSIIEENKQRVVYEEHCNNVMLLVNATRNYCSYNECTLYWEECNDFGCKELRREEWILR